MLRRAAGGGLKVHGEVHALHLGERAAWQQHRVGFGELGVEDLVGWYSATEDTPSARLNSR